MDAVAQEFDRTTALIRASEEWTDDYREDPDSFAKLLKAEAKYQRTFLAYLKNLSERAPEFISWGQYGQELDRRRNIQAASKDDDFSVDVLIDDTAIGKEDGIVFALSYDQIETIVIIGTGATEEIYKRTLRTSELTRVVKDTARKQTAELVGKKVDKNGDIVDNPKAEYRISDETRNEIRESIRTSLGLGEDQATATARLSKTLKNPRRAELVAQTEAVNGYQGGMLNYAKAAGATGKVAQYLGPRKGRKQDLCGTNANAGIIDIDKAYPSGHQHPAFHPRCRCGEKFIWPEGA